MRLPRLALVRAAALGMLLPAGWLLSCSPPRAENLLFILTDEQRYDTLPIYGNRVVETPNLDRLAEEGIVFRRAYVTQPVCSPARSSLLTGLWPHQTGVTANNVSLPAALRTLPELLADRSYHTAYMGKWHLGDELDAQQGFAEWVSIEDGYTSEEDRRSDYHRWLIDQGYHADTENGTFSRGYSNRLPLASSKTTFLAARAVDFLERAGESPFILYVSFLQPHTPNFGPLDTLYRPEDVVLPPTLQADLGEDMPLRYRSLREGRIRQGGPRDGGEAETYWREEIARYLGLVTQVDIGVGAILEALDRLGLADRTVVVFTSEHGKQNGEFGLHYKQVPFESSVRIPMLMRVPGQQPRIVEQRVSQIDLVPTLLDVLGATAPRELPGRSLMPLVRDESSDARDVFLMWHPNGRRAALDAVDSVSAARFEEILNERSRTILGREGWKLTLSDVDTGMLFDLRNNSLETTNRFNDPAAASVRAALTERLLMWQRQVGDTVELRVDGWLRVQ